MIPPSAPSWNADAGTLPRRPRGRAADRGPARPGLRSRPAEEEILPLPRGRGSPARALPRGAGARRARGLDPLLADPARGASGPAAGPARHRSRPPGAGDREGPDPRHAPDRPGRGLAAGLPGRRSRLLCPLRLPGRAADRRHAGRERSPAAVSRPGRRHPAAGGRRAATRGLRARPGARPPSRACPCSRPCRAPSRRSAGPWRGLSPGRRRSRPGGGRGCGW